MSSRNGLELLSTSASGANAFHVGRRNWCKFMVHTSTVAAMV